MPIPPLICVCSSNVCFSNVLISLFAFDDLLEAELDLPVAGLDLPVAGLDLPVARLDLPVAGLDLPGDGLGLSGTGLERADFGGLGADGLGAGGLNCSAGVIVQLISPSSESWDCGGGTAGGRLWGETPVVAVVEIVVVGEIARLGV